jgi:hypothetical protein
MNNATQTDVTSNFKITASRHAAKSKQFPNGIWYGEIDGHACTAPAFSEAAALEWAKSGLLGTSYIAGLTDHCNCLERNHGDAQKVAQAKAQIAKYYQHFPAELAA